MSEILPDLKGGPSGWNAENHYFYEVMNRDGKTAYIQLAFSSRNSTPEFLELCERINQYYPDLLREKGEWKWRVPFKTTAFSLGEVLSKDDIFAKLDECYLEIKKFEADLKLKLQMS